MDIFMVLSKRIELPTYAMSARRSSIELRERLVPLPGIEPSPPALQAGVQTTYTSEASWSHGRDLNSRTRVLQTRP
jgi:hypothetical protein